MKCPKCHYLSFDPEPRCRNCGYTLALDSDLEIRQEPAPDAGGALPDLALRSDVPAPESEPPKRRQTSRASTPPLPSEPRPTPSSMPGPFDKFTVAPRRPEPSPPTPAPPPRLAVGDERAGLGGEAVEPPPSPGPSARRAPPAPGTTELPLFVRGMTEDTPPPPGDGTGATTAAGSKVPSFQPPTEAAAPAPTPRRPPRRREVTAKPIGPLDRDLLEGLERIEEKARRAAAAELSAASSAADDVGAGRRLMAAAFDASFVAGISAGVVAMTLRWVDLNWERWTELPAAPLTAFLALIVAGYLFLFTAAGGQTAGKMLLGIRVVDAGPAAERVTVRQALYRSVLAIPSVLAFGAGFVPALTGEHLALHDRLTGTRVVRV